MPRSIKFKRKTKSRQKIEWYPASDIEARIKHLVTSINLDWVDLENLHCVRSENANTRAYARIWGLGRIWQQALGVKAAYVLEVISEKYDKLPGDKKDEVLLHELAHIPKNFSGSLMPHTRRGPGSFHDKLHGMISAYNRSK